VNARRLLVLIVLCVAVLPASSATASFPGAVGRVVFTSDRTGSSEIYSAAADGTDVKRLTWNDGSLDPAWSPDGSRIAYDGGYQGRLRLFVMNQDGSDQHLVSPSPDVSSSTVDDVHPAWSPDGTQLAFASTRPTGAAWHVWVMNADGTNLRELPDLPGDVLSNPDWSPDGTRIAVSDGSGSLVVINADGTNERRLTTPPTLLYDESPDWSPDGNSLAFSERTFDGTSSALFVINVDGSGQRQLTSGVYADYRPSWSPDGTSIVFDRRAVANGSRQLYTVAAGGAAPAQLLGSAGNDMAPNWGSSTISPVESPPQQPLVEISSPADGGGYVPGIAIGVAYRCTSLVSFIVSCSGSQPFGAVIDTSFAGVHQFTVTGTDAEGRQTTATVSYFVPDLTPTQPPHVQIFTPAAAGVYVPGNGDRVFYACTSDFSVVVTCTGSQPFGAIIDTSFAGVHQFTVTATDLGGRQTTATVSYTVPDLTPPTVEFRTPADGGTYDFGANATVGYACSDGQGGSGILYCVGAMENGAPLDTSRIGTFTFAVTAVDKAFNVVTATATYSVVDRTPPSVTITTPSVQAVYKQDQIVGADYICTDRSGGSDIISCSGNVPSGAVIDTSTVGAHTFTVTAIKAAHNTTTASRGYTVLYDFSGFSAPVVAFPTVNAVKAGEGVPLKFSLHGNRGNDIFAPALPTWTPCATSPSTSAIASGALSYNTSLDRYTYLVATDKSWAGTCKDLTVTLRDGTTHSARFTFGK
jgi:Tol biopolymer transport system component